MISNDIHGSTETPVFKRDLVLEHLRTLIVTGELKPGRRMPTRSTIESQFKTGRRLVDEAFQRLEEDGFVYTEPKHGTYVSEHPPHLCRYGFIMGQEPGPGWQAFTAAIRREIPDIGKQRTCRFVFYENIMAYPDTPEHGGLLRDILAHRLAGLMFRDDGVAHALSDTPAMTAGDVSRVILAADTRLVGRHPKTVSICVDENAFFGCSLDYLREHGRRRVAVLGATDFRGEDITNLVLLAEAHGMIIKPHWVHEARSRVQFQGLTALLLSLPPDERPDGFIITNESSIDPVGSAVLASGYQAGRDLDMVAYSSMSCTDALAVPMRRLGVGIRERLRVAVDVIERQNRGESVPPCVLLRPLFEEELVAAPDSA